MASSFTTGKDLEKPGIGEQAGVWGYSLNTDLDKIDAALGGVATVSINTDVTLTTSQSNVAQFDYALFKLKGDISGSGNSTITFPDSKPGIFKIDITSVTFGSNKIILKTNSESNGVNVSANSNRITDIYSDGTSVRVQREYAPKYIIGEIRMYTCSGALVSSNLPFGWHVCNGNNNTVDLRNKFVRGAAATTPGATGGSDTVAVSINGISINTNTASHTLTTSEIPSHTHQLFSNTTGSTNTGNPTTTQYVETNNIVGGDAKSYVMSYTSGSATVGRSSPTGGGSGHTHGFTYSISKYTKTVSTLSSYYALVYIQYTGA